jgi:hypothetical protein
MIPPSYRRRNVPTSNLNPGRVNCQTRVAAPRARDAWNFLENLRTPSRGRCAGLMCQFCLGQVYSTKFSIIWRGMHARPAWNLRGMMRGTPRALRKFTQCLCYAREIKTYTLQGTAVVCFSQRRVNTNFGIIYNTLHVCTRLWLRYCACEKILQKYRSPKRRFYK